MNDAEYAAKVAEHSSRPAWIRDAETLIRVSEGVDNGCILDFGCGNGTLMRMLHETYPSNRVFGVEPNPVLMNEARTAGTNVWHSLAGVPARLRFDTIYLSHVLGHLDHPRITLLGLVTRLNPGGRLAILNPNLTHTRLRKVPDFLQGRKADPTIKQRYTLHELERFVRSVGLFVEQSVSVGPEFMGVRSMNLVVGELP